jgi:tetratricopeptide (TPR) repeat protein
MGLGANYGALAYCCDDDSSARENLRLAIHWKESAYSTSPGDIYLAAFLADEYYSWLFRWGDADPTDEDRDIQRKAVKHLLSMIELPEASRSKRLARNASLLAWMLVTTHNDAFRQPETALRLAKWACDVDPTPTNLNMLGTAHCEAERYDKAVELLSKVAADPSASDNKIYPLLFLAKAHWHLKQPDKAREAYQQVVQWLEKNEAANSQLTRIRKDVEELLGIRAETSKVLATPTEAEE